jgi:hypothetical protein
VLAFLNIFFFVFHTVWVLFNLTGWMFRKTRRWNLVTLLLTLASWTVFGIWRGFGYCVCTDWHWQVRDAMGLATESNTYIHFLILKLTGLDLPAETVLYITGGGFVISFVMSVTLNMRDYLSAKAAALIPSAAEVEKIMDSLKRAAESGPTDLQVGDKVKVIEGPFQNFKGEVDEVSEKGSVLRVMINIFGRMTPVQLTPSQLEKL